MLGSFSLTVLGCAVLVFVSFIVRGAGSNAAEQAAIRKLIHLTDEKGVMGAAPSTGDVIFWSGAYKRPIIGNEKGEFVPGDGGVQGRIPKSQKSTTDPVRIVVSDSHDLAYEHSFCPPV